LPRCSSTRRLVAGEAVGGSASSGNQRASATSQLSATGSPAARARKRWIVSRLPSALEAWIETNAPFRLESKLVAHYKNPQAPFGSGVSVNKVILATIAFLAPVGAPAAPVYLDCVVNGEGGNTNYKVALDEPGGEVTYEVLQSGKIFKLPALFTSDAVTWVPIKNNITELQFSVSRVDLKLTRTLRIGDKSTPETGVCKMAVPVKRVF
jgi:hypothetical protein